MKKKAIAADSDTMQRESFADYAQETVPGAEVERVYTERDLMARLREDQYSLVLVACCLDGDYDGPDVVRRIREYERTSGRAELPVYVVSIEPHGEGERRVRQETTSSGASGYFHLMPNMMEFQAAVRRHLE